MSDELDALRPFLANLGHTPQPADIAAALRAQGSVVSDASVLRLVQALRREATGAGPLDALLADARVTDVLVNAPDQVFVDRGSGLERADVAFASEADVRRLACRLAAAVGRRLDDAQPYVDARLPDGTRVHAILAPIAQPGTCISLRVPARRRLTLEELVAVGSVPAAGAQLLERVVAARLAFLVSGGTGSGKTTLLGTLLSLVPSEQRLVIVEDSRELAPIHPHCVWLEARPANAEGAGAIPLTALVRQALRMRPDRVVVGEVRGAEVVDLLAALNTGHEGGCGTVHANSAADVPARLEALGALAGLGRDALHAQAASALDAIIHVERDARGMRRVREVCALGADDTGRLRASTAWRFDGDAVIEGPGAERLAERLS